MKLLIPILQMLGVAVGSFAVFALLVSYLRYRKMQLISLDQTRGEMSPAAAVMVMLTVLREDEKDVDRCLLRFEAADSSDAARLRDFLKTQVRKEDKVFLVDQDQVLVLLKCPQAHFAAAARRLHLLLPEAGFMDGCLHLYLPEANPDQLLSTLKESTGIVEGQGWVIQPEVWSQTVLSASPEAPVEIEEPILQSVSVDPLTGVLKAERVPRAIRRLLAASRRSGRSMTLVRVDVDELGSYNTTYGRETGDRILKKTAAILMANCRETDLIGRMGEGAFILGMEGRDEDVLQAARRMSEQIKNSSLVEVDSEIRFSAAFGLASMPVDGKNPLFLLEKSAWALQEAKGRGRGMCMAYQPSLKPKSDSVMSNENHPESF